MNELGDTPRLVGTLLSVNVSPELASMPEKARSDQRL